MNKTAVFFGILGFIIINCICFMTCVAPILILVLASNSSDAIDIEAQYEYQFERGKVNSQNKFLSIKIDNVILNEAPTSDTFSLFGDFGAIYGYQVKDQLMRAADDESIKGIILEISSPGGTVTGSIAIADGINYYREKTGKPVIAYGQGLVASGAYWVAAACDYIMLDYGSSIGSIGVLFGPFEYYDKVTAIDGGLLGGGIVTQNGIESYYITAGEYKDLGNPFRKLTQEELAVLQEGVDITYNEFVKHVSTNRDISESFVKSEIRALIYENSQAQELKLIDETANKDAAYAELASRANVGEDYKIVSEQPKYTGIFGAFVNKLDGSTKQTQLQEFCWHCSQMIVYHGDPTLIKMYSTIEY